MRGHSTIIRTSARGAGDAGEVGDAGEACAQAFVVADHDQRRAGGGDIGEQEVEECLLAVAVERGGGLVGDDQLGRADQRARGGHALLLAYAETCGGSAVDKRALDAKAFEKPGRCGPRAALRLGARAAAGEKASGSTTLSITEP